MREQAEIRIESIHRSGGEEEIMRISAPASVRYREGLVQVLYRERAGEDREKEDSVLLKLWDGCMEMLRRGETETSLRVEPGRIHPFCCRTAFGSFSMETEGLSYRFGQNPGTPGGFEVRVHYRLLASGEAASECEMRISIRPRD